MANEKKTIEYEVQFKTNEQGLKNASMALERLKKNLSYSTIQLVNNQSLKEAQQTLLEIRDTANLVESSLVKAFNPKLGTTNIESFKRNLAAVGLTIQDVQNKFKMAGSAGAEAFSYIATSLTNVRLRARETESIFNKMGESVKKTLGWTISSSVIHKLGGSIQEAYGYVKHLDTSLNDIRVVTEYSADAMDRFAEKANKAATALGKSTTDYTEAALIYYQQGLGEEDVAARTDVTLKTANVTQQSTSKVSEQLTAIWNGYKVSAEEAETYIDKVAKVAASTAADLEEMATGMSKVASAANAMGVDIDQMNAILATTISVTRQAPETIGAAYKTIFARMTSIKAGESVEDGATLDSYTAKMGAMGVNVLDVNGKLRDMGEVIEEVGNKWNTMSREQQIALSQIMAGTRQYNNLMALFENWDMYQQALETSANAIGTLQTQQDIYMESTAAHLQQLRTAAEGVYDSLLKPEDINKTADGLTKVTRDVEVLVDGLGGLKGILPLLLPAITNLFSSNIGSFAAQTFGNFTVEKDNLLKLQSLDSTLQQLKIDAPETAQAYLQLKEALGQVAGSMKPELFNEISEGFENQAIAVGGLEALKKEYSEINAQIDKQNEKIEETKVKEQEKKDAVEQTKEAQRQAAEEVVNAEIENDKALEKVQERVTQQENLNYAIKATNEAEAEVQNNLQEQVEFQKWIASQAEIDRQIANDKLEGARENLRLKEEEVEKSKIILENAKAAVQTEEEKLRLIDEELQKKANDIDFLNWSTRSTAPEALGFNALNSLREQFGYNAIYDALIRDSGKITEGEVLKNNQLTSHGQMLARYAELTGQNFDPADVEAIKKMREETRRIWITWQDTFKEIEKLEREYDTLNEKSEAMVAHLNNVIATLKTAQGQAQQDFDTATQNAKQAENEVMQAYQDYQHTEQVASEATQQVVEGMKKVQEHADRAEDEVRQMTDELTALGNATVKRGSNGTITSVVPDPRDSSQAKNGSGEMGQAAAAVLQTQQQLNSAVKEEEAARKAVSEAEKEAQRAVDERLKAEEDAAKLEASRQENLEKQAQEQRKINVEIEKQNRLSQAAVGQAFSGITQIVSGLSAVWGALNSIKNLWNVWTNEEYSATQKFVQTITVLLSLLGSVGMAVRTLTHGFKAITSARQAYITTQAISKALSQSEITVDARLIALKQAEADARRVNAGATDEENRKLAEQIVRQREATEAQVASFMSSVGLIAAIVGAIVAWGIAIARILKAVEDFSETASEAEEKLKSSNQELQAQKENADKANTSLTNLNSAINDLSNKETALSQLSKGTEEWNNKLQEVNDTILKIIENYPELAKYLQITNGRYSIQEEGLKEYQQTMQKNAQLASLGVLSSTLDNKQRNFNLRLAQVNSSNGAKNMHSSISGSDRENAVRYDIGLSTQEIQDKFNEIAKLEQHYLDVVIAPKEDVMQYFEESKQYYQDIIKLQNEQKELELERLKIAQMIASEGGEEEISEFRKNNQNRSAHELDIIQNAATTQQAQLINNKLDQLNALNQEPTWLEKVLSVTRLSSDDENKVKVNNYKQYRQTLDDFASEYYQQKLTAQKDENGNYFYNVNGQQVSEESIKAEWARQQANLAADLTDTLNDYSSTINGYAIAIVQGFREETLTIDQLTDEDLKALENIAETHTDDVNNIKNLYEEANKQISRNLQSRSEKQGYKTVEENRYIRDWATLTPTQKKQIADKIHEAFKEGGSEGVNNIVEQMKNTDFEAAINLTITTPEEDLDELLKKSGVKKEDFLAEKELRKAAGEEYSNEAVLHYLQAQKDLNELYKERETIFGSLENFDWKTASDEQQQYLKDIKVAFDAWTGKDLSFDFIRTHLELLKTALEGDADAAKKLSAALNSEEDLSISGMADKLGAIIDEYDIYVGLGDKISSEYEQSLYDFAKQLGLDEEETEKLFNNLGYFKQENGDYIKSVNAASYFNKQDYLKDLTNSSTRIKVNEIVTQYGGLSDEILEKNGWHKVNDLPPYWEKYSWGKNIWEITNEVVENRTQEQIGKTKTDKPISLTEQKKISLSLDTGAIDIELKKLNNELKDLQALAKDLTGQALINNLEAQLKLEQQINDEKRKKLKTQNDYLGTQKTELENTARELGITLSYDSSGRVDMNALKVSGTNLENQAISKVNEYEKQINVKQDDAEGNLLLQTINGGKYDYNKSGTPVDQQDANKYVNREEALGAWEQDFEDAKNNVSEINSAVSNLTSIASNYNSAQSNIVDTQREIIEGERRQIELEEQKFRVDAKQSPEMLSNLEKVNQKQEALGRTTAQTNRDLQQVSNSLEDLGEASDYSGKNLVTYNQLRSDLLDKQIDGQNKLKQGLEEEKQLRQEELDIYHKDAEQKEKDLNTQLERINNAGFNFQPIKLEDGTYDLNNLEQQYNELAATVEAGSDQARNLSLYYETIKEYAETYNKDVEKEVDLKEDIKDLDQDILEAARGIHEIEKEQVRLNLSSQFADANAEIDILNQKVGIYKESVSNLKTVFDKASMASKGLSLDQYLQSIDNYNDAMNRMFDGYESKFETLAKDWLKGFVPEDSAVKNFFNADNIEDAIKYYEQAQIEIVDTTQAIDAEILRLSEHYEDNWKEIEKLKAAKEELTKTADGLGQKLSWLSEQIPDWSGFEEMTKQWKTAALDREIKKVNRELSILQKQQSRIKGKDEVETLQKQIANLKKQQEVIKKHIVLEQKKLEILKSQLRLQKTLIEVELSKMKISNISSIFGADGNINTASLEKLAKEADITNEQLQILMSSIKEYQSLMDQINSQQDVITGLYDDIADMNYEIAEKAWEETRKAAEKALNALKIHIEVQLNSADLDRKLDRLQARIDKIRDTDFANQALLDMSDAVSYMTRDVPALIDGVSQLMDIYNSGAWEDYYDTQKEAYDDILNFTNQMIDKVNAFYDALDAAREKYAQAIDKLTSQNKELLSDLDRINKLANHGINITKLLFGEESYDKLGNYFNMINAANTRMLEEAKKQRDYYAALLNTIDPVAHPEEYAAVKSALTEAIDEVYQYAESAINNLNAALENAIKTNAKNIREEIAKLEGYSNTAMKDLAHDRQQQILKDFLDITESEYEINSLINKFNKSINDTDSLAEKEKLAAVMKEQVGYLEEQIKKTGRLTKYEVDRANKIYELTLKQMALDEAKDNKTQMRLRRDSQGNYRYEYVADQSKTDDAAQAVLDAEYQLYELDKQRVLELTEQKKQILEDYLQRAQEIMQDESLSQEEKEQYLIELDQWTKDRLLELEDQFVEAQLNIRESAQDELDAIMQEIIAETGSNAEEVANNLMSVQDMVESLTTYSIGNLQWYYDELSNIMDGLIGQNGDLQSTIYDDVEAINGLIGVDYELISEWQSQVSAMQEVVAQLEELEHMYEEVAQAAVALASAVAQLGDPLEVSATGPNYSGAEQSSATSAYTAIGVDGISDSDGGKKKGKDEDEDNDSGLESKYVYGLVVDENNRHHGYFTDPIGQEPFDDYDIQEIEEMTGLTYIPMDEVKRHGGVRIKNVWGDYAFDTGGYTGEWGSDGRVAILHQKELVLNARDTENFLKATDIMRSLQNNLDTIKANVITQPNVNVTAPTADFNQNVRIEANFPNVSNSREIEEAFNNLVNLASQRAATLKR